MDVVRSLFMEVAKETQTGFQQRRIVWRLVDKTCAAYPLSLDHARDPSRSGVSKMEAVRSLFMEVAKETQTGFQLRRNVWKSVDKTCVVYPLSPDHAMHTSLAGVSKVDAVRSLFMEVAMETQTVFQLRRNVWKSVDKTISCFYSDYAVCSLPVEPGPCKGYFPKWGFQNGRCEEFIYGGCEGNENRFPTEADCVEACGQNVCQLPLVTGPCEALIPRWGFRDDECVEFTYGGCQGNANNFESLAECIDECGPN
ncbi:BPTI/Kunitz domain-containing protein [Holothuria leucospilota]|uniref:BPTI/Kunitz domain-containing protein n=1 Tax=Holothuria leucospilota TaxID=206669 RepID=A0A9Q1CHI3_HOLLE|nr:BPTI/Kunitz domain-containing protein [Holothuria leucospilota]